MVTYDPEVVQELADALYRRASNIVTMTTLVYGAVGGAIGYAWTSSAGGIAGLLICGLVGFYVGLQKTFFLKLQAQTALCQVQIEKNTHRSADRKLSASQKLAPVRGKFDCPPTIPLSIWREDLMKKMNVAREGELYVWDGQRYDSFQSLVSAMNLRDGTADH